MLARSRRPLAGVLVVLAAACGRAEAEPPAAAPVAHVVEIVARDYAFESPAVVPAGLVTFRMTNEGATLHHAALVRLEQGKTAQDFVDAIQSVGALPEWAVEVGGPNASDPHGGIANLTTVLQPGEYMIVCFVDVPGRVPHFAKGMLRPLRVTGTVAAEVAAPAPTVTMRLDDYHFGLSAPLTAGKHVVRVENAAAQAHEVQLVRMAPGKTAADLDAWFANPDGPPPGSAIGGVAGLDRGESGSFEVELTPGDYLLLCFIPDAGDGRPHLAHGMVQAIRIEA